jgi:hypothetical protein
VCVSPPTRSGWVTAVLSIEHEQRSVCVLCATIRYTNHARSKFEATSSIRSICSMIMTYDNYAAPCEFYHATEYYRIYFCVSDLIRFFIGRAGRPYSRRRFSMTWCFGPTGG